jgi:hypothetical protein
MKANRSASVECTCVVGMPCGKPLQVFSVPFFISFADNGPAAAWGKIVVPMHYRQQYRDLHEIVGQIGL